MNMATADLYDKYEGKVEVVEPIFGDYGGRDEFSGQIVTLKVFEDNTLVRTALEEAGNGRVLVIDGGGSLRCALVGDMLAALAHKNNWSGVIVYGCIRDAVPISSIDIGVKALATNPRKSVKKGVGDRDVTVQFAGVKFVPGQYIYADADGIIVSATALTL